MRVLVTGASGYVGAHLAVGIAKSGFDIVAVGGRTSCPVEVKNVVTAYEGVDLVSSFEVANLIKRVNPQVVVHAAALARAEYCEQFPKNAQEVNVTGTQNIILACKALSDPPPYLIFISTDYVFDGAEPGKECFSERDLPTPRTVYAQTKYAAEKLIHQEESAATILRLSLVYGGAIGKHVGPLGWMTQSLKEEKIIDLFVDEWRTPVFIGDVINVVCTIIERVSKKERMIESSLFHIGGDERISRYEFGLILARVFGLHGHCIRPQKLGEAKFLAPRPYDVSLSNALVRRKLGVEFCDIASGLLKIKSV